MEEKTERHQVVIVGGGATGLTLALCLEQLGVDYVLLEAYGDLTPDAGASIVLFAHAQRVLGQLGLGADGVRSVVRREMWRHADDAVPAADRGEVGCEYGCYYASGRGDTAAVRTAFDDACPGALVSLPGGQIVVGRGLDDEVYVLCIWARAAAARRCRVDAVPALGAAEVARALARFRDVVVADNGVRVRDLLDLPGVRGGATALPHYALRKWAHGRLVILGDAAHKFNPAAGQGANSCIDGCAELVNALQARLGERLGARADWPLADLALAFRDLENAAVGKVTATMKDGQDVIRLLSWRGWFDKFVYRYIVPYAPVWLLLKPHSAAVVSGTCLKGRFQAPDVQHEWKYKEEISSEK